MCLGVQRRLRVQRGLGVRGVAERGMGVFEDLDGVGGSIRGLECLGGRSLGGRGFGVGGWGVWDVRGGAVFKG